MVDGVSEEERSSFARKLKAGFVLLVGLSAGLITLQADVGLPIFLGAVGAGIVLGVLLVVIAFPERADFERGDGRRRGRR